MTFLLSQIDLLFEPSPALRILLTSNEHQLLAESDNGRVTPDLINYVVRTLRSIKGRKELDEILNCHPRLGAQKVDSAHSQSEQKSLGSNTSTEQAARLKGLNELYERKFPGLRYVVFVNGQSRDVIMENMQYRIDRGDINQEREEAIQAMGDIAKDRLNKV